LDGRDVLGAVDGIPVGTLCNDLIRDIALNAGETGLNYNFGERPLPGSPVTGGQSATIGFWQNKNGQGLINAFDGGGRSTRLGDWLAATLPNIFGAQAGDNNLAGKTNDLVASAFQQRFVVKGAKLDAQLMAAALSIYATNSSLGGAWAAVYGFTVTDYGLGNSTYDVGSSGEAFGVANNTRLAVMDILLYADDQAVTAY
jgi:hypothetical protein